MDSSTKVGVDSTTTGECGLVVGPDHPGSDTVTDKDLPEVVASPDTHREGVLVTTFETVST